MFNNKEYSPDENFRTRFSTGAFAVAGAVATLDQTRERGYVDPRAIIVDVASTSVASGLMYLLGKTVFGINLDKLFKCGRRI